MSVLHSPKQQYSIIFIAGAALLACCFNLLVLPNDYQIFWPRWLILTILFFNLYASETMGVTVSWGIGLFYDVLSGNLLGMYALVLLMVSAISNIMKQGYHFFSLLQKIVVVYSLVLGIQILIILLQSFFYGFVWSSMIFLNSLFSTVVWIIIEIRQCKNSINVRYPTG